MKFRLFTYVPFLLLFWACQQKTTPLYELLPSSETGIDFVNNLTYDKAFNVYAYRNFYNGGGVAIGDVNNDGLEDIYFTSNLESNKLYLNKGNFQFEDVTVKAGVAGEKAWSTGVAMADVNADGWLDIYVCNSGDIAGDDRQNELFINQGDGTFIEQAEQYGIADKGLSTHGVFFDYDRDGDLDLYLLNNSFRPIGSFNLKKNERLERDSIGGDKLYRNDLIPPAGEAVGGFKDVSSFAGIYGSIIGFGLGVTVGDVNRDGWQDIYVSNDFFERDYLYINNQDGTFKEDLTQQMRSISAASMGADMGDLNHDGYPEIFVTEMLPEKDKDIKQKTTFEDWNKYQENLKNDYYHQFTRNMLQLNNGDGTFSEIGRMLGVEATDWSWGALILDMDNDELRDIFVANGIYQDLTDQDYIDFIANENTQRMIITREGVDFKTLIDSIPIRPIPNYAFHQEENFTFKNRASAWGLSTPSHSNGAAYSDLDNDGDLDLVVNNINMPAFVYRNHTMERDTTKHFLNFKLVGNQKNTAALGTRITLKYNHKMQYIEHMPMRGFQSSVSYKPHFGLGNVEIVDTVIIDWISGQQTVITQVATNQTLTVRQAENINTAIPALRPSEMDNSYFKLDKTDRGIGFRHTENIFSDFDRERLMYHMLSTMGPKIAVADVNGDKLEDFYVCGAKDSAGQLFIQLPNGKFQSTNQTLFAAHKIAEETDCLFFDADLDDDLDLYVASGGNEFPNSSAALIDRLYFNNGKGQFSLSDQILPTTQFESTSCVKAADYDKDGDQDLFVGIRSQPFFYGKPVNGYLLQNDGTGNFKNSTPQIAPELTGLGMITDALFSDYDGDQDIDLIVVGEWMPITFFNNQNGVFTKVSAAELGLATSEGWWNCIKQGDFNGDGKPDFALGNHGLNSRFRATADSPLRLFVHDFDQNGSPEPIIARYEDGELLPFVRRHELISQMPSLKKKFLRYSSYVGKSVEEIFGVASLSASIQANTHFLESAVALSRADGSYELKPLPKLAQYAPMFDILVTDHNNDGFEDILMVGNFYHAKPEFGRYDASYGVTLNGNGHGNFEAIPAKSSGFKILGEARAIVPIFIKGEKYILIGRNNDSLQIFKTNYTPLLRN